MDEIDNYRLVAYAHNAFNADIYQGKMNEKLSVMLSNGHIQKEKEANRWLNKLKKGR